MLHTPSLTALLKTFSAYDVLDLVDNSDGDDSFYCDVKSKGNRGNGLNRQCMRQPQKNILIREELSE